MSGDGSELGGMSGRNQETATYVCVHGAEGVRDERRTSGNADIGTFWAFLAGARGHDLDLDHRAPRRGRCPAWGVPVCGTIGPRCLQAI